MGFGMTNATRAEVCIAACADAWRGDGEILASPMGAIPTIGARLAALTFEPDLVVTDGEAYMLAAPIAVGSGDHDKKIEGWVPFRMVFDVVWAGRRHVMMGATQISRYGDQNISCVGDWTRPKAQLLGVRGAPGNTANHATSYWVPKHSARVFVAEVDMVSGVGYRRAADAGLDSHEIRRVVSNLGVFDFVTDDHRMRLASVHPGVTVDEVVAETGFELVIGADVPQTRTPTDEELRLIRDVLDPQRLREREVAA